MAGMAVRAGAGMALATGMAVLMLLDLTRLAVGAPLQVSGKFFEVTGGGQVKPFPCIDAAAYCVRCNACAFDKGRGRCRANILTRPTPRARRHAERRGETVGDKKCIAAGLKRKYYL